MLTALQALSSHSSRHPSPHGFSRGDRRRAILCELGQRRANTTLPETAGAAAPPPRPPLGRPSCGATWSGSARAAATLAPLCVLAWKRKCLID